MAIKLLNVLFAKGQVKSLAIKSRRVSQKYMNVWRAMVKAK